MSIGSGVSAWLKADTVFFRVCFFLVGAVIVGTILWALYKSFPDEWWVWPFVVLLFAFGAWLLFLGTIATDTRVENSSDWLADGGDLPVVIFLVVVAVVAVPLTIAIRYLKHVLKQNAL